MPLLGARAACVPVLFGRVVVVGDERLGPGVPEPHAGDAEVAGEPMTPERLPQRRADDLVPSVDGGSLESGPAPVRRYARPWASQQILLLVIADFFLLSTAMTLGFFGRFGAGSTGETQQNYVAFGLAGVGIWMFFLASARCYESRFLGVGTEEFRGVSLATLQTFGTVGVVSYLFDIGIARGFLLIVLPVGFFLLLVGRFVLRKELQQARRDGRAMHRVLIVGDRRSVANLAATFRAEPSAGFSFVGACLPDPQERMRDGDQIPVFGTVTEIAAAVDACQADTVAVTAGLHSAGDEVRRISWALEGRPVDLVVAPAITDVAGPRITMRPVAGLPLIYVDEPQFTGVRRVLKRALDVFGSLIGLILLSPFLVATGLLVRFTSSGSVLFKQPRSGKDGVEFTCWKFRSMYADAEDRLAQLLEHNEGDGLLFKIKDDPRITPLGRFLRRSSIDELPQLVNVLRGEMSLVGPRPLAVSGDDFAGDVRRRLLVRPGITGLWQVSGREAQSWDDVVRLDLDYVENWSFTLDIVILMRTLVAVFRGRGAY